MNQIDTYSKIKKALAEISVGEDFSTLKLGANQLTNKDLIYRAIAYVTQKRYNVSAPFDRPRIVSKGFKNIMENRLFDNIDRDLFHLLAPQSPLKDRIHTRIWMAVAKLYHDTKARALEVPNLKVRTIVQTTEALPVGPIYKHGWWYPNVYQPDLVKYICEHNVLRQWHSYGRTAAAAAAQRAALERALVCDVARRHGAAPARVLLMWAVKRGLAVVPAALYDRHIRELNRIFMSVGEHEMFALDSLRDLNKKYCWDPIEIR